MRWSTRRPVPNSILATGELCADQAKDPVTHNSSETGNTVGVPLKDSSGSKLNVVMKITAMCGVVVDVFAGAFRREYDNHGNLLAVHEIAETWKQSTLKGLALDYLSTIIPVVRLDITFLFAYLFVPLLALCRRSVPAFPLTSAYLGRLFVDANVYLDHGPPRGCAAALKVTSSSLLCAIPSPLCLGT